MDKQNVNPSYWAVLPATVRYDEKIPASAKLIFAEISALTEKRGFCYASNEYLMQLFGVSERTLQRHLKALEGRGYIQILDGDGGVGRRKIFAGINPLGNPDKIDGVTPTNLSPNPDKNVTHISKRNSKSSDPPKAPQGAGADYVPKEAPDWKPERFAAFWKYYPLHKSKQKVSTAVFGVSHLSTAVTSRVRLPPVIRLPGMTKRYTSSSSPSGSSIAMTSSPL